MKSSLSTRVPALIGLLMLGTIGSATAQLSVDISTGLDASNNLITSGGVNDAHWTVPSQANVVGPAQTVYPNNADWYGGWLANGPGSAWIARDANVSNNGVAPYTFSTSFNLTGYDLSTAALSGSWAIDDTGTLDLNGHTIATLGSGAWGGLTAFSVPTGSSFFNQGTNTLSITITSDDQFLEAVRLQGNVTARALTTPEPGTYAMLGSFCLVGGAFLRRRKY